MSLPELTDPGFEEATEFAYRGRPFWTDVRPEIESAIRDALAKRDDVSDWQVIYIGYSRAEDQFVFATDCWLAQDDDAGDSRMTCHVFDVRFEKHWLLGRQVKLTSYDLGGEKFYGPGEEAAHDRYLDLEDLLLD